MKTVKVAARIVDKWLRKGNMARCMRDILPHSGLSLEEREIVSRLVHQVVRYKRYYEAVLDALRLPKNGENYIKAATGEIKYDVPYDLEIHESISPALARILEEKREFLKIINREPETMLCSNLIKASRQEVMEMLQKEGLSVKEYIPETAIITTSRAKYSLVVKEGFAHVQDASSQMVAKITVSLGDRILDYCAGSGGKTLAMASFSRNKKKLYAYDVNEKKLKALEKRAKKHAADIKVLYSLPEEEYDVVLVDAPCSGIGAASRNPEAKYVENFQEFQKLQLEIMESASQKVRKDGYILYVVCSFSPEETVGAMQQFLKKHRNFEELEISMDQRYFKKEKIGGFLVLGDILYLTVLHRFK